MTAVTGNPPIRLMIVDDHAVVREGLKAVLGAADGLEVVAESAGGEDALARCAAADPDVVLMDIGMREINGIELTRRLLEAAPARRVLVLTMHEGVAWAQGALQAGARGYVLKDSPSADLVAAIHRVMAGGLWLSPEIARRLEREPAGQTGLSERELQLLALLAQGLSSKHIAHRLDLSVRTVESHRQNIRRKLRLDTQADLIKYAVERHGHGVSR